MDNKEKKANFEILHPFIRPCFLRARTSINLSLFLITPFITVNKRRIDLTQKSIIDSIPFSFARNRNSYKMLEFLYH